MCNGCPYSNNKSVWASGGTAPQILNLGSASHRGQSLGSQWVQGCLRKRKITWVPEGAFIRTPLCAGHYTHYDIRAVRKYKINYKRSLQVNIDSFPPLRGAAAHRWQCPCHSGGFWITHKNAPQSVWTGDQLVAEISAWQHSQQTDIRAPWRDSNPQFQQARGRRPTT